MASTNKTPNYGLNQWVGTDLVKREDFNSDNTIIDAKLKENADALETHKAEIVSSIAFFARTTAPDGWLKCNGALISRTTYSALFEAIGTTFGVGDGSTTFQLPDLRGQFVRGYDDGAGVDSGRVFGSSQADELKSHNHMMPKGTNSGTGASSTLPQGGASPTWDLYTDNTGGTETRPKNIALLACIKY